MGTIFRNDKVPFVAFTFLIALAKTSKIMLTGSGSHGHSPLAAGLGEKLGAVLAVGFLYVACMLSRCASSVPDLVRVFVFHFYILYLQ